jgi:coenzyme F420 hydrogenase subunit beta
VARAKDPEIRARATDGGVVTALLLHLFDTGRIDGAIVTKPCGPFQRRPRLAMSRNEISEAAGFYFDTSHGMAKMSDKYVTYSSIEEFAPMIKKGLRRVALVGTPCQIEAFRRMEVLGIVPSDAIKYCLGLICSGNFIFGEEQKQRLALDHQFHWEDVIKLNVKETFMIHLKNGDIRAIPLENLDFMKRYACNYCPDYSAEFADISFGGIGAEEGWTTLITRTPLGRAIYADATGTALEEYHSSKNPNFATDALAKVTEWSIKKQQTAARNRLGLGKQSVNIKG